MGMDSLGIGDGMECSPLVMERVRGRDGGSGRTESLPVSDPRRGSA